MLALLDMGLNLRMQNLARRRHETRVRDAEKDGLDVASAVEVQDAVHDENLAEVLLLVDDASYVFHSMKTLIGLPVPRGRRSETRRACGTDESSSPMRQEQHSSGGEPS